MIKSRYVTTYVVTVEHDKPIPDLADFGAQRAHSIDGVNAATVTLIGTVEQADAGKWIRPPYAIPTDAKG